MSSETTVFMGRGKPRKPAALRAKAKKAEREAALAAARPIPPPPKGLTEHERVAWAELKAILEPLGVFTPADSVAFEQLVINLAMIKQAWASLREGDVTEDGPRGPRQRPEVQVIHSAQKMLFFGLGRFGLTPSDRSRVESSPLRGDNSPTGRRAKIAEFGV
jgi:phage terminase small subunit